MPLSSRLATNYNNVKSNVKGKERLKPEKTGFSAALERFSGHGDLRRRRQVCYTF